MAEIINFNKARKARIAAEKAESAAENRVKFGRTKFEKAKVSAEKSIADRLLDEHKRDP